MVSKKDLKLFHSRRSFIRKPVNPEIEIWLKKRESKTGLEEKTRSSKSHSYASLWKARHPGLAYDAINVTVETEGRVDLEEFKQRVGAVSAEYTLEDEYNIITFLFLRPHDPVFFKNHLPLTVTHLKLNDGGEYVLERSFERKNGKFWEELLKEDEYQMIVDPLRLTPLD